MDFLLENKIWEYLKSLVFQLLYPERGQGIVFKQEDFYTNFYKKFVGIVITKSVGRI